MGTYFYPDIFLQGLGAGLLISLSAGWAVYGVRVALRSWYYISK